MRQVNGKRKEDGLKRERENERNEGLGGREKNVLKRKRKKVKKGSEESDWRV